MPDYGRGKRPMDKPSRQEERLRQDRDAAQRALDRFSDLNLRTLVERGERTARGSVEGESVGSAKGAIPRPTEAVALEGLPNDPEAPDVWKERADMIGGCIRSIASLLDHARVTMEAAEDKLSLVLNLSADEFVAGQHKTARPCRACQRTVSGSEDDRLREGYCNACRMAWKRTQAQWSVLGHPGAPDRLRFERDRLAKADTERRKEAS